jgi:hypothetical protein
MATRYEYESTCCNTGYIETRNETDAVVNKICVQCGQGEYKLVSEIKLDDPIV